MRDQLRCFALALLIVLSSQARAEPYYVHRAVFLAQTPFGALAWVDVDTTSVDDAKSRPFIYDLSAASCQELPIRRVYWFLINHRNPPRLGNVGFFAVRIVGQSAKGRPNEILLAYRNPGWIADDGKILDEGPPDAGQTTTTIEKFIRLHDDTIPSTPPAEERLKQLNNSLGIWHARPDRDSESSWKSRHIFASPSYLEVIGDKLRIFDARLLKFAATGSGETSRPVLFYFDRRAIEFDKLWISLSAPNFNLQRLDTEIRVGLKC